MTSFSRAKVIEPPAAAGGLLAAWTGAACVGAAAPGAAGWAGAVVGLAGAWPPAPPPHATMRPIAPALNRLVRNSRRVDIVPPAPSGVVEEYNHWTDHLSKTLTYAP